MTSILVLRQMACEAMEEYFKLYYKVEVNTIVKFKDSTSKDVKSIPQKGSKQIFEFIEHRCDIVVIGSMISDDTDRSIEYNKIFTPNCVGSHCC